METKILCFMIISMRDKSPILKVVAEDENLFLLHLMLALFLKKMTDSMGDGALIIDFEASTMDVDKNLDGQ
jgi:hypothetical protein